MRRALLIGGAILAISSSLAIAAPESLLPPGFDQPSPTPAPQPRTTPAPPPVVVPPDPTVRSAPVIQPLPPALSDLPPVTLPPNFPSVAEIEKMSSDEIDELLGLRPKFDIPAGARRSLEHVGVIARDEGGFPSRALARQPATLVRAALAGTRHQMVSRWGHILLRRTLASRLDAPAGMNPVEFAALRAGVLNRLGESYVSRTLVQDVDTSNYNSLLTEAAFDAYVATGDFVGLCPVARLKSDMRQDGEWLMARAICTSFAGNAQDATRDLNRILSRGEAPRIDVLLAQRYAGAAADGGRAVTIEWNGVNELNPWRYSLSVALGVEVPNGLRNGVGAWYDRADALSPALGLAARAAGADRAGGEGILSSTALVDLYSQIYADAGVTGDASQRAGRLREAYVAQSSADRVAAMRELWGDTGFRSATAYGRLVLTAYAAARIAPDEELRNDAHLLIASMLSAGLDRNALRWASVVPEGSEAWALLALAQPQRDNQVTAGAVDRYVNNDESRGQRKSQFLIAGLAGLGRMDAGAARNVASSLGADLTRESPWSRMITKAAEANNPALVALLAGLGMQGDNWDMMTARHLYLIVRSLEQVGLSAEARMIAAEAVARG